MASPKQFGFIHVKSPGSVSAESACSWVIVKVGEITLEGQGNLLQAINACAKVPTALALSVQDLIVTKITLPTTNKTQRRNALPYAIQDQLAQPATQMHWSFRSKGKLLDVVGISQTQLDSINAVVKKLNFSPKWLVADGLHLGGYESHWKVMVLSDSLLIQSGPHKAFNINSEEPLPWLQKAYDEAHKSAAGEPLNVTLVGQQNAGLTQWFASSGIDIKPHQTAAQFNSAGILSQDFDAKSCINLWPQKPLKLWSSNIDWKVWRLPYILTVLIALIGLGHLWLSNTTLQKTIDATDLQGRTIFQRTLPNTRLVDALSQLENQMLVAQSANKPDVFLPMLHAFELFNSALKKAHDESKIIAIRFLDDKLFVTLETSPEHLKKWPKSGVLEADFVYETKSTGSVINVIISSQEAR
jgi:type II secretion system protein L